MEKMNVGVLFRVSAFAVACLSATAMASPECAEMTGCDRKFCEMERQRDEAEKKGNAHQVAGLQKALSAAKENCTDEGLYQELAEDIEAAEADMAEYREDLEEALQEGDKEKITKYRKKLEEEKAELESLKSEQANF